MSGTSLSHYVICWSNTSVEVMTLPGHRFIHWANRTCNSNCVPFGQSQTPALGHIAPLDLISLGIEQLFSSDSAISYNP
jgi:hypothetical protein